MTQDEKFMRLALRLAHRGSRAVAPNPMVGAVIIKNRRIIGRGWHKKFGGPHAEVNAIRSVRHSKDLRGATLYVTLEPCRHWGKTPPCFDLIQKVGITRIVAGSRDPFQKDYKITRLQDYKITVLKGPIAEQCRELNKFFFTWVAKKRPYIIVKIAMSADGFVAAEKGKPVRITNRKQDRFVHELRAEHQAIMVGINTVLCDDPHLGVRLVKGQDPLRVVLDSQLRIPKKAKVLRDKNYLIATTQCHSEAKPKNLLHNSVTSNSVKGEILRCLPATGVQAGAQNDKRRHGNDNVWISPGKKHVNLKALFRELARRGISSILVEPGPTLYRSLKKAGLIDELIVFIGKKKLKKGIRFPF